MSARVLVALLASGAIGMGCLVPSFDDLKGNSVDAGTDGSDESKPDAGATGSSNRPSASSFACASSVPSRCALGTEVCCAHLDATISCEPAASTALCARGFLRCGDSSDCAAGERCCSSDSFGELGACKASCSADVICDPSKTPSTCPSPQTCTGERGLRLTFCQ